MKANLFVAHPTADTPLSENSMFRVQFVELLYSLSTLIVASLIITSEVAINHYIFLTVTLILCFCMSLAHSLAIMKWAQKVPFSHTHNNAIFFGFFVWLVVCVASEILLGVWLFKKDNSGWAFEDNQPDMSPFSSEYFRLLLLYAFWAIGSLLAMTMTSAALISHYYPEADFVVPSLLSATAHKRD